MDFPTIPLARPSLQIPTLMFHDLAKRQCLHNGLFLGSLFACILPRRLFPNVITPGWIRSPAPNLILGAAAHDWLSFPFCSGSGPWPLPCGKGASGAEYFELTFIFGIHGACVGVSTQDGRMAAFMMEVRCRPVDIRLRLDMGLFECRGELRALEI